MHYFTPQNRTRSKNQTKQESNMSEDIYNFLENIKPAAGSKDKAKQFFKSKQVLDVIPEDKVKTKASIEYRGLTDNIVNDYEYKDKARKGLLLLLNKMSGGSFCPEIKEYFDELKESKQEKSISKEKKDGKKEVNTKNLRRQNFIDKPNQDRVTNETIKDEDLFKLNFRTSGNKEKGLLTVLNTFNNVNNKQLTFKQKKKKKKKESTKNEDVKFSKAYTNDFAEKDLILFYSDTEVENSNKKYTSIGNDGAKFVFKSKLKDRRKKLKSPSKGIIKSKSKYHIESNPNFNAMTSQKVLRTNKNIISTGNVEKTLRPSNTKVYFSKSSAIPRNGRVGMNSIEEYSSSA